MGLSGLGLLAGGVLTLYALRTERPALIKNTGLFALGWMTLYFVVLVGTSLTSEETVLSLKERKAFCGFYLDCHLGVSVEDVQRVMHVGEGAAQVQSRGVFYVVTVLVSSDAVLARLGLENPEARLIGARGRTGARSLKAEQALTAAEGVPTAFARRLDAGQSYTTTLVFDVSPDVTSPRLLITKGVAFERFMELFLIGDEDSLLHRKTVFAL